ncbi:MAG: hypothetical protein S4CHLAM123_03180 [Chlamydiales bacterium]|nr:hypothetical protein [Chlamydiales bacterium]
MYRLFILIACLVSLSLSAQDTPKEHSFDCKLQGEFSPAPLFAPMEGSTFLPQIPKVNLVTGEYCEDECDLVIAGVEPLSIRRFYNHFSGHNERIYGHWRINPEASMLFNFEAIGKSQTFAYVGERNSSFFLYEQPVEHGFIIQADKNKGFTNSSTLLSGQNHPLNTRISYTKGHEVRKEPKSIANPDNYYWWDGTIKDGRGGERTFKTEVRMWPQEGNEWPCHTHRHPVSGEFIRDYVTFEAPPYQAQITEERRPNGNVIRYEYENRNAYPNPPTLYTLKSIKAYSNQGLLLGFVELDYVEHSPDGAARINLIDTVYFRGSDERTAIFFQPQRVIKKRANYDTTLSRIEAPGKPVQTYDYLDLRTKKGVDYAKSPYLFKVCQGEGYFLETTYDWADRVAVQSAPVGPDGETVPVASYIYEHDSTLVYDGENNTTRYRFDSDKRIVAVEKYKGEALYSAEKNEWDPLTGNLLKKSIEDAAGALFYSVEYIYDKNHNAIEERVEGAAPILRTYSDDGFNLKLTESDRPNKEIRYTYLPHTNLLTSEILTVDGTIIKRTFHFYDSEIGAVCIKTVVDDGISDNPEDFTDVTFRYVTEISPKRTLPCLGFPEEIREYAGDELLKKVRYTYHPSGKIASEERYDAENRYLYTLYNEYDSQERLISTRDALGNQTTFAYDNNFNLISQQGPRSDQHKEWRYDLANRPIQELEWQSDGTLLISQQKYDKNSQLIATIDPAGFETRYTYDALGRVIAILHPDGAFESKEYDVLGNVIKETDPNGYSTRKTFNFRGQPTAIYHPDGTEEHFTYNQNGGTVSTHIDSHGIKTEYTYDLLDNLIRTETASAITTATYSSFRLLSETDAIGGTTHITYDLAGRKTGERKGEKKIHITYNTLGQLCKTQTKDVITQFSHDLKGQLLEKTIEGCFQENYTYDEAGNRITSTTCAGTTHTSYNSRGEPTQIRDPLGNITELTYSYEGGFSKTIQDPKGVTISTLHDSRGRPIELQTKNLSGELIQKEERIYDLAGNQTHALEFLYEGTTLQKTITREWRYGPKGRLETLLEAGEKKTRYFYDSAGRLEILIKPDGRPIHREYDHLSRLARYHGQGIDYIYTYDSKNRLTTIKDAIHKTTLECTYDIYDNLISEKLDSDICIHRNYDPYGKCISLCLPDDSVVTYTYKGPCLHTLSRNGLTHTYAERNLSGRPTKIILPNQETVTIEWDPLLRWKHYQTPHFSSSYTYDEVGNLTQYSFSDPTGDEELLYQYDDLRQLITENEHNYTYDSLFNRRSKNGEAYALNNLLQITHDGQQEYHYDKNGNLLSDGICTYEYDLLDRLIAVTKDERRTLYAYDALNRRISKDNDLYLWDGQQEIGMMRNGYIRELRILGEGKGAEIGAAVLLELDNIMYIPIHDHRGSLVTLLTLAGKPISTHRYTTFGESNNNEDLSPWGFSSKRYDPETGFIYFGKRYYHPALGRWITPDPQGFQDGPNLYAYVYNSPHLYCDPLGLLAQSLSEVHNVVEFCSWVWYCACSTIEWIGHNLIPMQGVRDLVEAGGRWAKGGGFFQPRQHACVLASDGIQVPHLSKVYHNGILTNLDSGTKQRDAISEANGGVQVILLFNPSHGIMCDLIDSLIAKCGIKTAYERMCAHYYATTLQEDPIHEFDITAHSQGCTRLNNTGNILMKDQCQHMKVEAYASATIISEERFKKTQNYLSKLDMVPLTSSWSYIKNVAGIDSNVTFLTPHSMNPLTEHYLMGNTYWEQIKKSGDDFQRRYL